MIENLNNINWSNWKPMPSPETCKQIVGPDGPGVYQIRNKKTQQFIQFGIGTECRKRMKSFFPSPYGTGTRNNNDKREFILINWQQLEYRTLETETIEDAKRIEMKLKQQNIHLFNT
jgi:excinuclease UvrABC nuclease subunit